MSDKVFFDSNILVYAYDTRDRSHPGPFEIEHVIRKKHCQHDDIAGLVRFRILKDRFHEHQC